MTRKTMAAASLGAVAAMLIASLIVGSGLPENMQLPTHWNLAGEADSHAPKWTALLLPPALIGAVSLLFYFLPALEPRGKGLERSQGLYLGGWAAILFMGLVIEVVVLAAALDWALPVNRLMIAAGGVVFAAIGNQLGKSRSMYLIGLRTPWTLASEEVWIRTHRLAGKLMVVGGVAMVAAALVALPPALLGALVAAVIAVAAGIPVLYSLVLWRREKAAQPSGYSSTGE
jgi:uncharacterized membrane protein